MNPETLIRKARTQLLLKNPFFGHLASVLALKEKDLLFPVGTDGKTIYYSEQLIEEAGITAREMEGVLAHEIMHLVLKHAERRRTRGKMKWNMATDLAINAMLAEWGYELPDGVLMDERCVEKSAEEIYNELPDIGEVECPECGGKDVRRKELKVKGRCEGSKVYRAEGEFECRECGHRWTEEVNVIPSGDGDGWEKIEGFPIDDHDLWDKGEFDEQWWRRKVAEASNRAKGHGELPAGLKRMVEDLVHPRIHWRRLLERYIRAQDRSEYTWRRPNRRHVWQGLYYPSLKSTKLEVAVAVDTSGSVSEKELKEFMGEVSGILDSVESFRAELFACDAEVHSHETARSKQDFQKFMKKCEGGGGTDFRPVFEKLESEDVDCLVYLTDGHGFYPEVEPRYDVVWALNKRVRGRYEPPFGREILIVD